MVGRLGKTSSLTPLSFEPQARGERLVSWIRIVIALIVVLFLFGYVVESDRIELASIHYTGVIVIVWGFLSAHFLVVLARGYYRPWMAYISIFLDVAMVTAMQIAFMQTLPLNLVNGPISAIYFVVIGMTALRKSRRLVIFSGLASAALHLTVATYAFRHNLPALHFTTFVNSVPMGITFLDEAAQATCMAALGFVIGYVTKELVDSERHYQDLFEHAPDGILIASKDGRIMTVNRSFADMVDSSPAELAGRPVASFLGHNLDGRLSTPPPPGFGTSLATLSRVGGERLAVRTASTPVEFDGETCVEMSVRDVTGQVELERQLAQSQKMETLGRLAGGLAHDFNNMLGGIIGAASLAERKVESLPENAEHKEKLGRQLDVIQQCAERARDVVGRLLTFSRRTAVEARPVDLSRIAIDVATICRNTFESGIEIKLEGGNEPAIVEGDGTSLTQALLNLCINAKDAMPQGGPLVIGVTAAPPDDPAVARHPDGNTRAAYYRLGVSDAGVGMNPDMLDKIFDPFFTTKPVGEGTGLGLSMVYNIARQHAGFVDVGSEPGRGSTFRIYLPRARPSVFPGDAPPARIAIGSGRVLVVDDEETVRASLCDMLSELGYEIAEACDGEQALSILGSPGGNVDLVLLDMVMPHMDGPETLRHIRERDTDLKVLIISGYWTEEQAAELVGQAVSGFLEKPFSLIDLSQAVATALSGAIPARSIFRTRR
ncbi:MAG: response regulator [Deltaproteobacteria bacterium]|nr:response regulator [Deltaproteobacteria bacterium]